MKTRFCLICIFLFATFLIKAQKPDYILLAEEKEKAGAFTEASVLYERVLFEEDKENSISIAMNGKINCFKKTGFFAEATNFIKTNINLVSSDSIKYKLYEQWVVCSYLANQLDQCISLIEQSKLLFPSFANTQWLNMFMVLCLNEQNKWVESKVIYKQWLIDAGIDSTVGEDLYKFLPKLKSENKAGWLSTFIPGAGQLYAGKPWEALAALIIQGSALYYGYVSFQSKYYLSAWLVGGGIFGSFHFGGTRRSEELVKQYNKRVAAAFNENVRTQLLQQMQLVIERNSLQKKTP